MRLYTTIRTSQRMALSLLGFAALFHVFDAVQGMGSFVLRGYRQTFWPMVIYGVALWGLGLGGGAWIAFSTTPIRPAAWRAGLLGGCHRRPRHHGCGAGRGSPPSKPSRRVAEH